MERCPKDVEAESVPPPNAVSDTQIGPWPTRSKGGSRLGTKETIWQRQLTEVDTGTKGQNEETQKNYHANEKRHPEPRQKASTFALGVSLATGGKSDRQADGIVDKEDPGAQQSCEDASGAGA